MKSYEVVLSRFGGTGCVEGGPPDGDTFHLKLATKIFQNSRSQLSPSLLKWAVCFYNCLIHDIIFPWRSCHKLVTDKPFDAKNVGVEAFRLKIFTTTCNVVRELENCRLNGPNTVFMSKSWWVLRFPSHGCYRAQWDFLEGMVEKRRHGMLCSTSGRNTIYSSLYLVTGFPSMLQNARHWVHMTASVWLYPGCSWPPERKAKSYHSEKFTRVETSRLMLYQNCPSHTIQNDVGKAIWGFSYKSSIKY